MTNKKRTFFRWITNNPLKVVLMGVVLIMAFAIGIPKIVKDTTADAFIPKGHSSLVNKDKLVELFGIGVFTPE